MSSYRPRDRDSRAAERRLIGPRRERPAVAQCVPPDRRRRRRTLTPLVVALARWRSSSVAVLIGGLVPVGPRVGPLPAVTSTAPTPPRRRRWSTTSNRPGAELRTPRGGTCPASTATPLGSRLDSLVDRQHTAGDLAAALAPPPRPATSAGFAAAMAIGPSAADRPAVGGRRAARSAPLTGRPSAARSTTSVARPGVTSAGQPLLAGADRLLSRPTRAPRCVASSGRRAGRVCPGRLWVPDAALGGGAGRAPSVDQLRRPRRSLLADHRVALLPSRRPGRTGGRRPGCRRRRGRGGPADPHAGGDRGGSRPGQRGDRPAVSATVVPSGSGGRGRVVARPWPGDRLGPRHPAVGRLTRPMPGGRPPGQQPTTHRTDRRAHAATSQPPAGGRRRDRAARHHGPLLTTVGGGTTTSVGCLVASTARTGAS